MTTASQRKDWDLIKQRVKRIGVLRLWRHISDADRWAVSLNNRTYNNFVEIHPDKLAAWKREFDL